MIGIRDKEEVICWEIRTTCHGPKTKKIFNRIDRAAFRFPFYAYTLNDQQIVINYMSQKDIGIHYKMEFADDQSYIHQLCFSNNCDLYVLAHERDKKVVIYRIRVGLDLSIEVRQGLSRQSHQELASRNNSVPPLLTQGTFATHKSESAFQSRSQV